MQAAQGALNVYNTLGTEGGLTQALTTASIKFGVGVSVSTSELHGATQGALASLGGGYSLDAGLRGAGGAIITASLGTLVANKVQKLLNEAGLGDGSPTTGQLASLIAEVAITGFASSLGNLSALTAASVDMTTASYTHWKSGF